MSSLFLTRRLSSKAWLNRHVNDIYVKKAVSENLRSRSAFKLSEIQEKHKLIKKSDVVVDLGAAPGGWMIIASKYLDFGASRGMLFGVDLLPIDPIPNCQILQGDFTDIKVQGQLSEMIGPNRQVDVVLSDMLTNACGHQQTDHIRSIDLSRTALLFAEQKLKTGGSFLCKYLRGADESEFIAEAKEIFGSVKIVKPKSSRSESAEIYLLCQQKRGK